MKKLVLILAIFVSANSLQSMEAPKQQTDANIDYSKLPPITLPQIYHHFSEILLPDIAFYIFSLQPHIEDINATINGEFPQYLFDLSPAIETMLSQFGYCLTAEILQRNLLHENKTICDIKFADNGNILHDLACKKNPDINAAKLYLQVADSNAWKLLSTQTNYFNRTPLYYAAAKGHVELVKFFLDIADRRAHELLAIRAYGIEFTGGRTVFDVATPEVKEVIRPYLNKES